MIITGQDLYDLIHDGMVTGMPAPGLQIEASGVDLTVKEIHTFEECGRVDLTNKGRILAHTKQAHWFPGEFRDLDGTRSKYIGYDLKPGAYKLFLNEHLVLPVDVKTAGKTRSTLLRNGAFIADGYGDPGFEGYYAVLLIVANPRGIVIEKDARVLQVAFYRCSEKGKPYAGIYQHSNVI